MRGLFPPLVFQEFGPTQMGLATPPTMVCVQARRPAGLKARVRLEAPRRPGVYGMIDAHGELYYVGKAKCLRRRLLSYFRARSRARREARIVREARQFVWEITPTELCALLRELELIQRWQPRCNIQGQPRRRRRTYVCLGRPPAPHVFLTTRPPANLRHFFGPVPMRSIATDAVRRVNDLFQLRDCPHKQVMVFAEEKELFPMVLAAGCLRHEIGSCLAPCAAAATVSEYQRKVNAARAFLCGSDLSPLAAMEGEMRTASARLDFERAASIRDRLASLQWLVKHLERLRRARAMSAVYPVRSAGGTVWHLIHRGQARAAIAAPQTAETRERARRLISSLFTGANPADPDASEWTDGVLLVDAWFRRHPAERNRLMTVESVLGRCDG